MSDHCKRCHGIGWIAEFPEVVVVKEAGQIVEAIPEPCPECQGRHLSLVEEDPLVVRSADGSTTHFREGED